MNKSLLFAAMAATALSSAGTFADEPTPDNTLAFNVSVTSDYRYRGISQSRLDPALQGGMDYTNNPTGFYLGAWASSIKWIKDAGGDANFELDIYGGKRGNFSESITYDIGVLSYVYVDNKLGDVSGFANADTTELYAQLGFGPAYVKYSHSLTNLFGFVDSEGSGYVDVGANIELVETLTLNLHVGNQSVKNNDDYAYSDWKIGVTKDFGFMTASIAAIGTDSSKEWYYTPKGEFTGKSAAVLTLTKTF
jgi:uncharacterized protein (TIGR02001 family)